MLAALAFVEHVVGHRGRVRAIMLDEPTNYLDRESLAALIGALKVFEGGVLIITHNRDFSESICKE